MKYTPPTAAGIARDYSNLDAAHIAAGNAWYTEAHEFARSIASLRTGLNTAGAAGIIAALSPRKIWEDNKAAARAFILDPSGSYHTRANMDKARAILELNRDALSNPQHWIEMALEPARWGHKVWYFYKAILHAGDYHHGIALDCHMLRYMNRPGYAVEDTTYHRLMHPFLDAAAQVGTTPARLQAALWTWQRNKNPKE